MISTNSEKTLRSMAPFCSSTSSSAISATPFDINPVASVSGVSRRVT